jgi:anti-anti-sigma regulatory factor
MGYETHSAGSRREVVLRFEEILDREAALLADLALSRLDEGRPSHLVLDFGQVERFDYWAVASLCAAVLRHSRKLQGLRLVNLDLGAYGTFKRQGIESCFTGEEAGGSWTTALSS